MTTSKINELLERVEEALEENERWQVNNNLMLKSYEKTGELPKIQFAQEQDRIHKTMEASLKAYQALLQDIADGARVVPGRAYIEQTTAMVKVYDEMWEEAEKAEKWFEYWCAQYKASIDASSQSRCEKVIKEILDD